LTAENLEFFGAAYGLRGEAKRRRVDWALEQFGSPRRACPPASARRHKRLLAIATAASTSRNPVLDEPTSGPSRRAAEFWRRIGARRQGSR
jgi:ABC-2 type transport system ATP-binding protein